MIGRNDYYLKGYLRVEIDSPLPERFLNLCAFHQIVIWDLENHKDRYSFCMYQKDFGALRPICRKTNTKLTVKGHYGMPFFLKKYKNRKMFVISLLLCAAMIYALTLFIWQIRISGLTLHGEQEVLACLQEMQVQYGMRKSGIDCEAIETALRNRFDDFIWVAASVEGTQLWIQIKENTESYEADLPDGAPADLVAEEDGVIEEMITLAGTPLVKVGDSVEAGQVLISGREAYLDDSGEILRYEEMQAQGEVKLKTTIQYDDLFSYTYKTTETTGEKKYGLSLWFFGKQLTVNEADDTYALSETGGERKTLVVGSRFYLPVDYQITTVSELRQLEKRYSKEEAKALANVHFQDYIKELKKKGVEIIENRVTIVLEEHGCHTSGTLTVICPTGKPKALAPLETEMSDAVKNAEDTQ